MVIGGEYGRIWSRWFAILITNIFVRGYYLQYTNFLSLNNKESVLVSAVIHVHASGKQEQIKAVSVPTRLIGPLTQGNIRVRFFWTNLQILFLKKLFKFFKSFISAVRNSSDSRQPEDEVSWAFENGCFFVTCLFRSSLDKKTLSRSGCS